MTLRKLSVHCLLLLVAWSPAATNQAQQPGRNTDRLSEHSYGFVSPNTRENLTLREAIRNLNSPEEFKLIKQIRAITCQLRVKVIVVKALGSWSDGAEQTTLFRVKTDLPGLRYVVSSLGKSARQKAVLYFHPERSGSARLYILIPNALLNSFSIAAKLDQGGIAYRTLVPLKSRKLIYVVDLNDELRDKVLRVGRSLRAKVISISGTGGFIGDNSNRQKAQQVFEHEIKAYQDAHSLPRKCQREPRHLGPDLPVSGLYGPQWTKN